jgi:hypothetical protein
LARSADIPGVRREGADTGSIVIGWLVKVAVVLAIVGITAFDAISVGSAHMSASDDANSAASAAASEYWNTHDAAAALNAATGAITSPNEEIVKDSLQIAPNGTVTLALRRTITTLVMHSIGPLKKYGVITVKGEASPPSP